MLANIIITTEPGAYFLFWVLSIWWHKSFCLCYLLNAKKDKTMFVLTCVVKWKASFIKKPRKEIASVKAFESNIGWYFPSLAKRF